MTLTRILLIALAASTSINTTPVFAGNAAKIQGDNNTLIYQVTGVKGKAIVELPNGQRRVVKPGMKIAHGSKISVLENSVLQGFDIQNQCQVEFIECLNRPLYQDQLCARVTTVEAGPVVVEQPASADYIPQTVAASPAAYVAPVAAGGSFALQGGSLAPYLVGLGGSALLASVLQDDKEINIINNNTDSNNNNNDNDGGNNGGNSGGNNNNNNSGGNNANDNNNSGGNNANDNNNSGGGNNANDNNNSGGSNDNSGGSNNSNDDSGKEGDDGKEGDNGGMVDDNKGDDNKGDDNKGDDNKGDDNKGDDGGMNIDDDNKPISH